jgi:acyl transferase domain-containing protein
VLFGPPDEAKRLHERLSAEGAICQELPFGRAYHTALFKPLADAFRLYFQTLDFGPGTATVYSASTCAPFPDDANGIRELAARQWEHPVRFTETVQRLYEDGYRIFLEVGPSGNLTSFVSDTLRGKDDVLAVSSNSRRKSDLGHLHQTLAQLFAAGVDFEPGRLFAHRSIAELDLISEAKAPAKPLQPLKLLNPVWKLPDEYRRPAPAAVVTASAAPATPAPMAIAPAVEPAPKPAVAADPRLDLLNAHFALMQDFLDSQARVLGIATGTPNPDSFCACRKSR